MSTCLSGGLRIQILAERFNMLIHGIVLLMIFLLSTMCVIIMLNSPVLVIPEFIPRYTFLRSINASPNQDHFQENIHIFVEGTIDQSKDREWVMAKRLHLVNKFCAKRLGQGNWTLLARKFQKRDLAIVGKYNLAYCPIGKTGTNTWFARFVSPSKRHSGKIRR